MLAPGPRPRSPIRRARLAHVGEGPLRVALLDLDAADRVLDHGHLEALAAGVDRRRPDAVVGGQPADVDLVHVVVAEDLRQVGLLEARVALVLPLAADVDDRVDVDLVHRRMKLGPVGAPHAMDRPRAALGLERGVVGRMPVPGGEDQVDAVGQPLHRLGDLVAARHLERSARGEVVLEVDDQQGLGHGLILPDSQRCYSAALALGRGSGSRRRRSRRPAAGRRRRAARRSRGLWTTAWTPPKNRFRSAQRAIAVPARLEARQGLGVDARLGLHGARLEVDARRLDRLRRPPSRRRPGGRSSAGPRSGSGSSRRCPAPPRAPRRGAAPSATSSRACAARPAGCGSRTG